MIMYWNHGQNYSSPYQLETNMALYIHICSAMLLLYFDGNSDVLATNYLRRCVHNNAKQI